jgi:hypothetical protein
MCAWGVLTSAAIEVLSAGSVRHPDAQYTMARHMIARQTGPSAAIMAGDIRIDPTGIGGMKPIWRVVIDPA